MNALVLWITNCVEYSATEQPSYIIHIYTEKAYTSYAVQHHLDQSKLIY